MAQQENPGIIGTVMSYIPGYGSQTEETVKAEETAGQDAHTTQSTGDTTGASGGQSATTGQHYSGSKATGVTGSDHGSGEDTNTGKRYSSDKTGHEKNFGTDANTGNAASDYGTGTQYSKIPGSAGQQEVTYEDDDTGTHHSGYNPQSRSSQESHGQRQTQGHDDGVRGAPIEGDGVKGYAIGAPVGSGDTEKPDKPGDPSGQVSGAHLEYGPEETDTRDNSGRGTVATSQGQGDSSFANVKTDDGDGNSTHVMTRTNESHMHSSSVTQT